MRAGEPTVRIYFENLAVLDNESDQLLPLSRVKEDSHIHGGLRVEIGGRFLPAMGFWGSDDVCFSAWIVELENVFKAFEGRSAATYIYDEGEQSQPAFLFEREADEVFVSVVDAAYSGGSADPDWQRIGFLYGDFQEQYQTMKAALLSDLLKAAPKIADKWWNEVCQEARL